MEPETPLVTQAEPLAHVGVERCAECHQEEFELWRDSHHDLAMAEATEATVLGDFDEAKFTYAGVTSTFRRDGDSFRVETDGPNGELTEYEIAYTFGVEPLQQYLIGFPDGRLQALNVVWDTRPTDEGGQRWFHLYPDEAVDHRDPLHWTGVYQNWNHACADCHSTGFEKGYDAATDRFDSSWQEIDVSCEACHGPGSRHVAWAEAHERGEVEEAEGYGLAVDLQDRSGGVWEIQPETGIAERTAERSSRQQVESCARCHSRRSTVTVEYRHAQPLLDSFRPALIEEGLYHPDGHILDEVYVWGSFLQSTMYEKGVTCSDCHDAHGLRILSPDAVCAKCHAPDRFALPEHHFHPAGSSGSSCIECHMGSRTYMGVDERHDHFFRVPRPDLTASTGAPDTCSDCHADRSLDWVAGKFREWYGDDIDRLNYGETLALGWRGGAGAAEALEELISGEETPAIARATALALLGSRLRSSSVPLLEQALADQNPLIRFGAAQGLSGLPAEARWRLGARLLDDPVLAVRLEAAQLLAAIPPQVRAQNPSRSFDRAIAELRESYRVNADRAPAQLALGTLAADTGDAAEAERALERAIHLDPTYGAGYANLADLYRALGRDRDGVEVLRRGLERLPNDGSLRHAYGLLLIRQGRKVEAIGELERAAELRPDVARYGYVLAVAIADSGDRDRALEILEQVHDRHPGDLEVLSALVGYLRETGAAERAADYESRLRALS